tara:strand:+ start:271 stop:429 length:159 start_codon:yes stop_codon:yes gene_type:complete
MFVIDLLKIVALVGTGLGWRFEPSILIVSSKLPKEETACSMMPKLYSCIQPF